ncbi:hypothetical protein IWZ00DRAFT_512639 [Phyllosticta capitalensis]
MHPSLVDPAYRYACALLVGWLVSFVRLSVCPRPQTVTGHGALHFFFFSLPLLLWASQQQHLVALSHAHRRLDTNEIRGAQPDCFLHCSAAVYDSRSFGC